MGSDVCQDVLPHHTQYRTLLPQLPAACTVRVVCQTSAVTSRYAIRVAGVVSPIPVWRTVPLRVQLPVRLRFTGWHASVRGCVRRDADACTHDGLTADRFSLAHGCVRDGEQAVAHGLAELCCM